MRIAHAMDIGGTRTKLGVVGEDGRLIETATIPTPTGGAPPELVDGISEAFARLRAADAGAAIPARIGVSVAGFLDRDRTMMQGNANLPLLCDYPLKRALEARLGHECLLEVDSNAAVLAEQRYGVGRKSRRLLGVTVGTGLGGGVILNGNLLRHTGECAGDLGHILVAPEGRACTCGARGCLEAMVCSAALSERAGGKAVIDVLNSARQGDRTALRAIEETAAWLAIGLASLTPLFAPDTIVVGGGIAAAGDFLLDPVRAVYDDTASSDFRGRVRIVASSRAGWEGVVGAASLVFYDTN